MQNLNNYQYVNSNEFYWNPKQNVKQRRNKKQKIKNIQFVSNNKM